MNLKNIYMDQCIIVNHYCTSHNEVKYNFTKTIESSVSFTTLNFLCIPIVRVIIAGFLFNKECVINFMIIYIYITFMCVKIITKFLKNY